MEWRYFTLLAAAIILSGCLAVQTNQSPAANPPNQSNTTQNNTAAPDMVVPGGEHHEIMYYGGYNRTYILHVPASYDGKTPYPLVFVFHGHGGSAESMVRLTRFSEKAEKEGFIVVYPQGLGKMEGGGASSWNAGSCCGFAKDNYVDDVGFVSALMDKLENELNVDEERIYATGFSNGGMMSYGIGCELAARVAAIAPVSGAIQTDGCDPSRPVPVIIFHGTADPAIPYDGGIGPNPENPPLFMSVPAEAGFWAALSGCSGNSTKNVAKDVTLQSHTACDDETEVLLYTIDGGVHVWPGNSALPPSAPEKEISATNLIWEFFRNHPKD